MILQDLITIQSKSTTQDDEGIVTESWTTFKTNVPASVQPAGLTQTQAEAWGVTNLSADAKKVFLYKDTTIAKLMRIVTTTETLEIRGVNHWNIHTELICVPVVGL